MEGHKPSTTDEGARSTATKSGCAPGQKSTRGSKSGRRGFHREALCTVVVRADRTGTPSREAMTPPDCGYAKPSWSVGQCTCVKDSEKSDPRKGLPTYQSLTDSKGEESKPPRRQLVRQLK
eukprot:scpid93599/ scgid32677/ 